MDKIYQELIYTLSGRQNLLLTTLLSGEDEETWAQCKYLIISHIPFLTLEMAVNRVCQRQAHTIPTPCQIHAALEYARSKRNDYAKNYPPTKMAS